MAKDLHVDERALGGPFEAECVPFISLIKVVFVANVTVNMAQLQKQRVHLFVTLSSGILRGGGPRDSPAPIRFGGISSLTDEAPNCETGASFPLILNASFFFAVEVSFCLETQ